MGRLDEDAAQARPLADEGLSDQGPTIRSRKSLSRRVLQRYFFGGAAAFLSGGGVFGGVGSFCSSPAGAGAGMRTSSHVWVRVLPKWIARGETSCVRFARLVTKMVS